VLLFVLLCALSAHIDRFVGWGRFVLIFLVGAVGGRGAVWAGGKLRLAWTRFSKIQRFTLVCAAIALVLGASFILNRGKPDADSNNFATCLSVCGSLILWGLYRTVSRVLGALWARFSKTQG
jgi:hypothetical protein